MHSTGGGGLDSQRIAVIVAVALLLLVGWEWTRSDAGAGSSAGTTDANGVTHTVDAEGHVLLSTAEWESVWDDAQGKAYYHHKPSGVTQWEKPKALLTAAELAAADAPKSNAKAKPKANKPKAQAAAKAEPRAEPQAAEASAGVGGASVWEAVKDDASGNTYFWNTESGAVTWTKPPELLVAEQRQLEALWEAVKDETTGKTYWWNTKTDAVTWQKPTVAGAPGAASASTPAPAPAAGAATPAAAAQPNPKPKPTPKPAAAQQQQQPAAVAPDVSGEWHELQEPGSGATYYWHVKSGATYWTLPAGAKAVPNPAVPDTNAAAVLSGAPVWQTVVDPTSGREYYWHRLTGTTSFSKPTGDEVVAPPAPAAAATATAAAAAADRGSDWIESVDLTTQRVYYWHRATGVTSWEKPDTSAGARVVPDAATAHCVQRADTGGGAPQAKAKGQPPFPYGAELRPVTDVFAETARERVASAAECRPPTLQIAAEQAVARCAADAFPFVGFETGKRSAVCAQLSAGLWPECAADATAQSVSSAEPHARRLYVAQVRHAFVDFASAHADAPGTVFDADRAFLPQPSVRPPRVEYAPAAAPTGPLIVAVSTIDAMKLVNDAAKAGRAVAGAAPPNPEPRVVYVPRVATALQVYPTATAHFRAETLSKLLWLHDTLPPTVPIVVAVDSQNVAFLEHLFTHPPARPALDRRRVLRHSSASVYAADHVFFAGEWPPLPSTDPHAGSHATSYPAELLARVRAAFVPTPPAARNTIVVINDGPNAARRVAGGATALVRALTAAFSGFTVVEFDASHDSATASTDASVAGVTAATAAVANAVQVFSSAAAVIGVHSQSLAHIVFCAPGTTVVEIGFGSGGADAPALDSMYYRTSRALGLDYWLLLPSGASTYATEELAVTPERVVGVLRGGERHGEATKPRMGK